MGTRILSGQRKLQEKTGFGTAPQERALMDVVGAGATGTSGAVEPQAPSTPSTMKATAQPVYTPGASGAPKSTQPTAPKQTKGSGYTNIQRILKASGTESGPTRLAQAVTGGVKEQTAGAQSALAGAAGEFEKVKVGEEERLKRQPAQAQSILSTATSGGTVTPEDIGTWKDITSGKYKGASELSFSPKQMRQAAESAALSKLAGGTEGRAALLQKYVGAPQYGQSRQTLDALLLGKGGSSAIRGALREGAKTEADIARQQAVAREQAKALERGFVGAAEEAKTGLETGKSSLLKRLEDVKGEFIKNVPSALERVLEALSGTQRVYYNSRGGPLFGGPTATTPTIRRSDLKLLGLTEADVRSLPTVAPQLNLDPSRYLSKPSEEIEAELKSLGLGQYASGSDLASIKALGSLAGEENLGLTDLGKVYTSSPGSFDLGGYRTYAQQQLDNYVLQTPEYKTQADATQKEINTQYSNLNQFVLGVTGGAGVPPSKEELIRLASLSKKEADTELDRVYGQYADAMKTFIDPIRNQTLLLQNTKNNLIQSLRPNFEFID